MTRDRQRCGALGEALAAAFLQARGLTILTRNFRCPRGEIDLVGLDDATIVFVEVRARRDARAGAPLESVTAAKQRRILHVADVYLSRHRLHAHPVRFDVVGVVVAGARVRVEHLPDAFRGA